MIKNITILILIFVLASVAFVMYLKSLDDIDLTAPDISMDIDGPVTDIPKRDTKTISGLIRTDKRAVFNRPVENKSSVDSDYISEILNPIIDRGKDAIAGERVLSFYDRGDLDKFINLAQDNGVQIIAVSDKLNAVRLKISDNETLRRVLKESPPPIESGGNYKVYPPNPEKLPDVDSPLVNGQDRGFGANALNWIGVSDDNSSYGYGIVVAVLDSSVSRNASLKNIDKVSILSGLEDSTHGTSVASIIAGNGNVVTGVAPSAKILSVDVVDSNGQGNTFATAEGIIAAVDAGANVINISMGTYGDSSLLRKAVTYALDHNVAIVASTGNDSTNVAYPAAYDGVIAVGAVDASGVIAGFSNYGEAVDIVAPGILVEATDPEDNRKYFSGTSASAPFVSGAIAALMSEKNNLTPLEAGQVLLDSANDIGMPGDDIFTGKGALNLSRALQIDEDGIYDLAAGQPNISYDRGEPVLILYVQNRGTEYIQAAEMDVTINGVTSTIDFGGVEVGETVAREITLTSYLMPGIQTIVVDYEAKIVGVEEINLSDNMFHAEFKSRK